MIDVKISSYYNVPSHFSIDVVAVHKFKKANPQIVRARIRTAIEKYAAANHKLYILCPYF
jgi:hypothetical protein